MIRRDALVGMMRAEMASDEWWDRLSNHEQEAYRKAHPGSKYALEDDGSRPLLKHGIGDIVKLTKPVQGHHWGQVHGWHIDGPGMAPMGGGLPLGKARHTLVKLKKSPLNKADYGPIVPMQPGADFENAEPHMRRHIQDFQRNGNPPDPRVAALQPRRRNSKTTPFEDAKRMRDYRARKKAEKETGADDWWSKLSSAEKLAYVKAHPRSKHGVDHANRMRSPHETTRLLNRTHKLGKERGDFNGMHFGVGSRAEGRTAEHKPMHDLLKKQGYQYVKKINVMAGRNGLTDTAHIYHKSGGPYQEHSLSLMADAATPNMIHSIQSSQHTDHS